MNLQHLMPTFPNPLKNILPTFQHTIIIFTISMGPASPQPAKPTTNSLDLLNVNDCKLISFTTKIYDNTSNSGLGCAGHSEIEALIQKQTGPMVLRLSYTVNGLAVHQLQRPRNKIYVMRYMLKVKDGCEREAWRVLRTVALQYEKINYELFTKNCMTFTAEVIKKLAEKTKETNKGVWERYQRLYR